MISHIKELLEFLESIGRGPNKGLSQNFLVDQNVVDKILQVAGVDGFSILEIGPGPGALTEALLQKNVELFAIEKDEVLAKHLNRFQNGHLRLICFDVLKVDLEAFLAQATLPMKVVANLPYHITTPILEHLLGKRELFSSFTVMVQEEVADKMMANVGDSDFGSFSLFLQFHVEKFSSFKVSSNCFYPKPKVGSKVIHCELRKKFPYEDEKGLFLLIRTAFGQRRKMIRSSLQKLYPVASLTQALVSIGFLETARPEELSLEQWILFHSNLKT